MGGGLDAAGWRSVSSMTLAEAVQLQRVAVVPCACVGPVGCCRYSRWQAEALVGAARIAGDLVRRGVARRWLYAVMVDDHRFDTVAHLFTGEAEALGFARKVYELQRPDDLSPEELDDAGVGEFQTAGWLYHAVYSVEGDTVWVLPRPVDEHVPGWGAR